MKPEKAYAVIWADKAIPFYGVSKKQIVISVEPKEDIKINVLKGKIGRPKNRYAEPLAVFYDKKEAEAYRAKNKDWETVEITLLIKK